VARPAEKDVAPKPVWFGATQLPGRLAAVLGVGVYESRGYPGMVATTFPVQASILTSKSLPAAVRTSIDHTTGLSFFSSRAESTFFALTAAKAMVSACFFEMNVQLFAASSWVVIFVTAPEQAYLVLGFAALDVDDPLRAIGIVGDFRLQHFSASHGTQSDALRYGRTEHWALGCRRLRNDLENRAVARIDPHLVLMGSTGDVHGPNGYAANGVAHCQDHSAAANRVQSILFCLLFGDQSRRRCLQQAGQHQN
jgi:hypothetical protein